MLRIPSTRRRLSRRTALAAMAGAALGFPAIVGRAQGRKIKFTMSWIAEGQYAFLFAAKANGYWSSRGLDVGIARGYGSLTTPPLIAAGQFDFGLVSAPAVILTRTKGVNLRSLALVDYSALMGVAVLENSPIRHPKDIEGKIVGQTLSSGDAPFFASFCAKNGVDATKVTIQNTDARVRAQALIEGQVDAITGYASSILPLVASSGKPARMMLYSDYGVTIYGNDSLVATPKMVDEQPEICQAVADGLFDAMKLSLIDPKKAERIFYSAVPELGMTASQRVAAEYSMGLQRYTMILTPDAMQNGLGWADMQRLDEMADFVMKYRAEPGATKPNIGDIYGNSFSGRIRLSDAEWKTVVEKTADIANLLHKPS